MFCWESLTKTLVTFNFNTMRVHWKICFFSGEGVHKLKGEVGQFADLRGEGDSAWEKRGGVFSPIFKDRGHSMTLPNMKNPKQKKFIQWLHDSRNPTKTLIKRMNLRKQEARKVFETRKYSNWVEMMLVTSHPCRNKILVIVI